MDSHVARPVAANAVDPAQLVARIRAGDVAAFEHLFHLHYDALWRFAYGYVGSRAVAEELVQDVMLEVWSNRGSWTVRSSVKSYLFGAVRNRALNAQRRARLEIRHESQAVAEGEAPAMGCAPADIDERLSDQQRVAAVAAIVRRMKEPRRTILTLRWDHAMTYAEIAAALGLTTRAVETAALRAIAVLRQELESLR